MYNTDALNIDFKGLTAENNSFRYVLQDDYFEAIEAPDVRRGNLVCDLSIRKTEAFFELNFHVKGTVIIPCDRCLDDMAQPISTDNKLIVKFGEAYSEEDDLVTIVEEEGILDVSWFIYEFIVLGIPIMHAHAPEECNPDMMKLLNEHTVARRDGEEEEKTIDPRWSKLSELLNKN